MIGQRQNRFLLESLPQLPHFMIVIGAQGSGRTTLIKEACEKRHILTTDCPGDIDTIRGIVEMAKKQTFESCYILSNNDLTKEAANALLKTCEESGPLIHLALRATDFGSVMDTLISRSYLISMEEYSERDVTDFMNSISSIYDLTEEDIKNLIPVFTTPGDMKRLLVDGDMQDKGKAFIELATKTANYIDKVSVTEAMRLTGKLQLKAEQKGKFSPDLFLTVVSRILDNLTPHSAEEAERVDNLYGATANALYKLQNNSLNKERVIIQWIVRCNGGRLYR